MGHTRLSRFLRDPHVLLAGSLGLALAAEYVHRARYESGIVVLIAAGVVALGLLYAWRHQDLLRLRPTLVVVAAFQLGYVLLHLAIGFDADQDAGLVYRVQGQALLDGDYPPSEYPLGAVLLFAFETLIGGGDAALPNGLLMILCQVLLVVAVWRTARPAAPWLVTAIAVWPVNNFVWEFRYDLLPAALLALGLALALRERWRWSGVALALGAFVKWTPGLALLALAAWLWSSGNRSALRRLAIGPAIVLAVHIPFAIWDAGDLFAAYTKQGGRSIIAESIWYLPLHVLGIVDFPHSVGDEVGAPAWADAVATVVQVLLVLGLLAVAARARRLDAAVAVAAMVPVAFLLTNRIFSPQFILVTSAAWAIAVAVLVRSRKEQFTLGAAILAAALLNAAVFPHGAPYEGPRWEVSSLGFFVLALGTTAWAVVRALRIDRSPLLAAEPSFAMGRDP